MLWLLDIQRAISQTAPPSITSLHRYRPCNQAGPGGTTARRITRTLVSSVRSTAKLARTASHRPRGRSGFVFPSPYFYPLFLCRFRLSTCSSARIPYPVARTEGVLWPALFHCVVLVLRTPVQIGTKLPASLRMRIVHLHYCTTHVPSARRRLVGRHTTNKQGPGAERGGHALATKLSIIVMAPTTCAARFSPPTGRPANCRPAVLADTISSGRPSSSVSCLPGAKSAWR